MNFKEWALQRFKRINNIAIHNCKDSKTRTVVYLKDGSKGVAICNTNDRNDEVGILMAYIKAIEKGEYPKGIKPTHMIFSSSMHQSGKCHATRRYLNELM